MKRKSLKLASLILLVFFSLTILDVASPPSARLFVDPPEIRDDSKQAGSTFTVGINVSEVSDLYGWQVNMSWDPSILEVNWHRGYNDTLGEHVGHGNGTQTVFQLERAPVKEDSEIIYVFVTNESLGHGDDVNKTFWLDHKPVNNESETIYVHVTGEYVGHTDGMTRSFLLDHSPVKKYSETIYVDDVPQKRIKNYTIDYPSGNVTFNTAPSACSDVTADYDWLAYEREMNYTINYTTGNVTFTDPPPTCTDLAVDYAWLNYTRNVHYTIDYPSGNVTFTVPPPNCTDIGADYTWWSPVYHMYEEELLKGPFPFDSHPYQHATEPYWEQTNVPTASNTPVPGWSAYPPLPPKTLVQCVSNATDTNYAETTTDDAEVEWGNFGFVTGNMSVVAHLEVTVECYTTEPNLAEQDKIEIRVTNDGGSTWSPMHIVDVYESEINQTVDVTGDFSWIPYMLTDANFTVSMKYQKVGATAGKIRVNYLAVKAVDTFPVDNPDKAYDQIPGTYASFRYNQTGNFTVHGFSHDFPSGAMDPAFETSDIVQVDFNMRYNTSASAAGKYKIVYYVDPSATETVLANWNSSAAPLKTHTWDAQSEPNGGGWSWIDVSRIRIVVETERLGEGSAAIFNEYEAWVTVTYERPTRMDKNTAHMADGYCLFSVITEGDYPTVSGNGSLASVEFEVLAYGDTVLNITDPDSTWLSRPPPPSPNLIPVTPEDGYFSNVIPGDFDKDKDVDPSDFAVFAGAYGTSNPPSNPACDFDGDGDVDPSDFAVFAGNYGRSV